MHDYIFLWAKHRSHQFQPRLPLRMVGNAAEAAGKPAAIRNSETIEPTLLSIGEIAPIPDDPGRHGWLLYSVAWSIPPMPSGSKLYVEDLLSAYNQGQAPQVVSRSCQASRSGQARLLSLPTIPRGLPRNIPPAPVSPRACSPKSQPPGKTNEGPEEYRVFPADQPDDPR